MKVVVAWLLSMLVGISVIYGLTPYLDEAREEIDSWIVCIYGSLHRLAWSICVAWVIFACFYGYGGMNRIPQVFKFI